MCPGIYIGNYINKSLRSSWTPRYWTPQLGDELIDQEAWYTAAYWTTFPANWSQVENTLVCNGTAGNIVKDGLFTVGKVYKITYTCLVTSGIFKPNDGYYTADDSSVSETKTIYFIPSYHALYLISTSFNGSVTALSIKEVTNFSEGAFSDASLIFTFDDAFAGIYNVAEPIFTEKGIAATCFIDLARIGTEGYMTWDQILELHGKGFDMQCHSQGSEMLTTLSAEQIENRLIAVNNAFTAQGLPIPKHHAYPGGAYNQTVIDVVKEYRLTARTSIQKRNYTFSPWDYYKLPVFYGTDLPNLGSTGDLNAIKAWLTRGNTLNVMHIAAGHDVSVDGGTLATKAAYLSAVIDHAQSIGLEIMTFYRAYETYLRKQILIA